MDKNWSYPKLDSKSGFHPAKNKNENFWVSVLLPGERIVREVIFAKRGDGSLDQFISAFTLSYTTKDGVSHDYRDDSGRIITMETGLKY